MDIRQSIKKAPHQLNKANAIFSGAVSCTILSASVDGTVLFGNNEDNVSLNTYYWIMPPADGKYTSFCLRYEDLNPQGGMNEKGLCCDANALPPSHLKPHPELPLATGFLFPALLRNCAEVGEAVKYITSHNFSTQNINFQIFLADAKGDSAVVGVGLDGEIAVTKKEPDGCYLVSTNFNRANHLNGDYPCKRYNTAIEMLKTIHHKSDLTVELVRSILDATHQEGIQVNTTEYGTPLVGQVNTVYSNIFNPKTGQILLYYHHQFTEVVELVFGEEVAKGIKNAPLKTLFSEETIHKAMSEYERYDHSGIQNP